MILWHKSTCFESFYTWKIAWGMLKIIGCNGIGAEEVVDVECVHI
jgi:hypothetical protein